MTSPRTAYVAHHQGETLEDTYRRADNCDEFGYPVPAELVNELETAQNALDAAVKAIRDYIDQHSVQEVDLGEVSATDEPALDDADSPQWHLYLIHDQLTPGNVRATLDVDELPVVGDVLDLPEPGFNGEPARWKWKVSLIEPISGANSATVYCTDAPKDSP